MSGEYIGNVVADAINPILRLVVEQVADHCHATSHPLARAAEFRVTELRHRAITIVDSDQHMRGSIGRHLVSLGQVLNQLLAVVGEIAHVGETSKVQLEAGTQELRP